MVALRVHLGDSLPRLHLLTRGLADLAPGNPSTGDSQSTRGRRAGRINRDSSGLEAGHRRLLEDGLRYNPPRTTNRAPWPGRRTILYRLARDRALAGRSSRTRLKIVASKTFISYRANGILRQTWLPPPNGNHSCRPYFRSE